MPLTGVGKFLVKTADKHATASTVNIIYLCPIIVRFMPTGALARPRVAKRSAAAAGGSETRKDEGMRLFVRLKHFSCDRSDTRTRCMRPIALKSRIPTPIQPDDAYVHAVRGAGIRNQ